MQKNNHSFSKTVTVMDKVEHTFITKWNYHFSMFTMPTWQPDVQQFQKNQTVLYMKISIMKVRLCLACQLPNLTNSKKKNYCGSFLWMVNRVKKTKHHTKFLCSSKTNFDLKIMLDCPLSRTAICLNNYFLKQVLSSLHE